jgi:hypothetical protein
MRLEGCGGRSLLFRVEDDSTTPLQIYDSGFGFWGVWGYNFFFVFLTCNEESGSVRRRGYPTRGGLIGVSSEEVANLKPASSFEGGSSQCTAPLATYRQSTSLREPPMAVDATTMVAANAGAPSLDHGSAPWDDGTAAGASAISRSLDASRRAPRRASHP